MNPSPFFVAVLGCFALVQSASAAMIWNANFSGYSVGATPTINNTGANNTFSELLDSGTLGYFTVQAAAAPYASNYVQAGRGASGTAFYRVSQSKIADMSQTGSTMVISFDLNRTSAGQANPTLSLMNGSTSITGSGIALSNPVVSINLWRVTYVFNESGSALLLPGTMGSLASGSAAAYSFDGTTYSLQGTTAVTGTENIQGFSMRINLSSGRADNFDNFGVWNSSSDSFNGTSVLQLAPGTVVPEPGTLALCGLGALAFLVRRIYKPFNAARA